MDEGKKTKQIIFDTNFFFTPFQLRLDIITESRLLVDGPSEIVTLTPVVSELERLSTRGKGEQKVQAKLALQMAQNVKIIDAPGRADGRADEAIIAYARERPYAIIATNDSRLRKEARKEGVKTIFVRGRCKLAIE